MTCSYALVLTSPPDRRTLSALAVDRAWSAIPRDARLDCQWLAADEAWEATFVSDMPAAGRADLRARISADLDGLCLDVNIVEDGAARQKKLLVADMDSTIIQQECIDEMADVFGLKPKIAAITERAMRGELDFGTALRERLSLLAGLSEADLQQVFETRLTLMPGARTLVATMKANGARCALVSGGFTFFTSRIAAAVGFNENHANTLECSGGRLTGNVVGPIVGREAKLATLQRLARECGLAADETLAVGDGANDLDMIRAAGLGVAYRAKPIVAADAAAGITNGDLTALLYLQGYRKAEMVV